SRTSHFLLCNQGCALETLSALSNQEPATLLPSVCRPLLLRDFPFPTVPRESKRGFRRVRIIEIDLILVDQGLTFPKIEALDQWTAHVKHVPQLIGHPFPSVFDDSIVGSVHVHAGEAHQ